MVSMKKKSNNQGQPKPKKNYVLIFDFDDVKTYERDDKGVTMTAFELKTGKSLIGIFVNETTIDGGEQAEGDAYARGSVVHLNFDVPGTELDVAEFKTNNLNGRLGAIVLRCDGSDECKIYGTPCAPLQMNQAQENDTTEAHNTHFELQTIRGPYGVGRIAKSMIPATGDDDIDTLLGIKKTEDSPAKE